MPNKSIFLLCLIALFSIGALPATGMAVTTNQVNSLPASVYALERIDPKNGLDDNDLVPVDSIIGSAHFVALGEAMHTSGGFHDIRFRIIRHLIRDKGFRVFALESNRLMSEPLIDFIDSCKSSSEIDQKQLHGALDSIYPVFASETMKDMVTWICQYNSQHPSDTVSFTGFDIQETSRLSEAISRALKVTQNEFLLTGPLKDIQRCAMENRPEEVTLQSEQSCSAKISTILQFISKPNELDLSRNDLELLRLNLRSLRARIHSNYLNTSGKARLPEAYQVRDQAMADQLLTLKSIAWQDKRVIIWSHNAHIEKEGLMDSFPSGPPFAGFKNLGQYLSEALEIDYKAIGLLAFQEEVNWEGASAICNIAHTYPNASSAEYHLRLLDSPYLIVDTSAMRQNRLGFFDSAAEYEYSQGSKGNLVRQFDGLIYLQNSQAMIPISSPACPIVPDWPKPNVGGTL